MFFSIPYRITVMPPAILQCRHMHLHRKTTKRQAGKKMRADDRRVVNDDSMHQPAQLSPLSVDAAVYQSSLFESLILSSRMDNCIQSYFHSSHFLSCFSFTSIEHIAI